ncbi:HEPN domain-containing protein [Tengunoibacter tsumagoiensis]|uniref:HEPN domain-containing protein n=1 Tax=Tengunoibacter tsumagoiensis TaxID=2014871 RepID=A0A402A510_9CHLR|nr:HEPN domain-containing protein [Tengunoibacter tsumagoiensis]GCE14091.1 hypothetical protein KTT_39500 [Tengunoibacter tsumagoiensis]
MSQIRDDNNQTPDDEHKEALVDQLLHGVTSSFVSRPSDEIQFPPSVAEQDEEEEEEEVSSDSDAQGAYGLFAEAAQDMATAGVELGLGRHFACVDFCNQAVEKAAQAVSLLRYGRRSMYDHDLRSLGTLVGAPTEIQDLMAELTPFHPEDFYAGTPPEEADEVISAEQASYFVQSARKVLRWARTIILAM